MLDGECCFGRKMCQLLKLQRLLYFSGILLVATTRPRCLQHNTHMEEKLCQFVCYFCCGGQRQPQSDDRQATRSVYMAALLMMTEMCRCWKSIFYAQLCQKDIWSRSLSCHEPPIGSRVKVTPQVPRLPRNHLSRNHTESTNSWIPKYYKRFVFHHNEHFPYISS